MPLNIGIIGAGGFAHFASKAFLKVNELKIIAVYDISEAIAKELSDKLNAETYTDYDLLLKNENINLIYVATPPLPSIKKSIACGQTCNLRKTCCITS